jgi:hypothetical protein
MDTKRTSFINISQSIDNMQQAATITGEQNLGTKNQFANMVSTVSLSSMKRNKYSNLAGQHSDSALTNNFESSLSLPVNSTKISHESRRCVSNLNVWNAQNRGISSHANKIYERRATVMMSQRSNAHGVKDLVSTLDQKCETACQTQPRSEADVPYSECALLAHIANDAYYRVVIGSVNGVTVIIKAMKAFPRHAMLQEACCTSLGNLCQRNGSNQLQLQNCGGIHQIIDAMNMHPTSIAVQSAACEALRSMSAFIFAPQSRQSPQTLNEIVELLTKVKTMYITSRAKERAEQLLLALQQQEPDSIH